MVQDRLDSHSSEARSPDDFLGFTIVRLAHLLQRRMDVALRSEARVSVRQFGALSYLAADPGIGSAALARGLLITPQSAGPLVDELVRLGLVVRDDRAPPGTRKAARLTLEGRAALERGYRVAERLRKEDEAELGIADVIAVNAALLRLLVHLSAR